MDNVLQNRFWGGQNPALADYVQCYVRGIWDKDLFYKAVFAYCGIAALLRPPRCSGSLPSAVRICTI